MAQQKQWAQFLVKWIIAAVGAVLIAVGAVGLVKTIYKSTLTNYPIESFRFAELSKPVSESGTTTTRELTDEEKKKQNEQIAEQRVLQEINDYALAAGQLLAGTGLWYVFRLILKKGE